VPEYQDDTAGGTITSIPISSTKKVYLGPGGTALNTLFELVDSNGNEIIDAAGAKCTITASVPPPGDGSLESGFAPGAVTVTVSPGIPTGTTFRLYYGKKGSLAELPRDAMTTLALPGRSQLSGGVRATLRDLHAPSSESPTWDGAWKTTVWQAAKGGLHERYYRSSNPAFSPSVAPLPELNTYDFDTAGSGSWIIRDGYCPTVYSDTNSLGTRHHDPMDAAWKAVMLKDSISFLPNHHATGFVYLGGDFCDGGTGHDYSPSIASFMHYTVNRQEGVVGDYVNAYTYLLDGAACTVGYDAGDSEAYVDVLSPYFFYTGSSSDICTSADTIEIYNPATKERKTYLIHKLKTTTRCYIRYLDGSQILSMSTFAGTLRWQPIKFALSSGAAEVWDYLTLPQSLISGMLHVGSRQHGTMPGPGQAAQSGHSLKLAAGGDADPATTPVFLWGYRRSDVVSEQTGIIWKGLLYADGRIECPTLTVGTVINALGSLNVDGNVNIDGYLEIGDIRGNGAEVTFTEDVIIDAAQNLWVDTIRNATGAAGANPITVNTDLTLVTGKSLKADYIQRSGGTEVTIADDLVIVAGNTLTLSGLGSVTTPTLKTDTIDDAGAGWIEVASGKDFNLIGSGDFGVGGTHGSELCVIDGTTGNITSQGSLSIDIIDDLSAAGVLFLGDIKVSATKSVLTDVIAANTASDIIIDSPSRIKELYWVRNANSLDVNGLNIADYPNQGGGATSIDVSSGYMDLRLDNISPPGTILNLIMYVHADAVEVGGEYWLVVRGDVTGGDQVNVNFHNNGTALDIYVNGAIGAVVNVGTGAAAKETVVMHAFCSYMGSGSGKALFVETFRVISPAT
jgi:hypothetical protein